MSLEYKFENRGTVQVRHSSENKRNPCWYVFAGTLLLLLAVGGWLFFSGYLTPADSTGVQAMTLRGKMNEQEKLLEKQLATIAGLEAQLASAKREKEVQVAANEALGKKLAIVEDNLTTQRDKLALYEKILSPDGLGAGVHIQHFALKKRLVDQDGKKADSQGLYQYHLVLAHIRNGDDSAMGSYTIAITGKQGGKVVTVTQLDVTPEGEKPQSKFNVKHYQSLEGNLLFPPDFTPESVKLRVKLASGDTPERLSKSYEWADFDTSDSATTTSMTVSSNKE